MSDSDSPEASPAPGGNSKADENATFRVEVPAPDGNSKADENAMFRVEVPAPDGLSSNPGPWREEGRSLDASRAHACIRIQLENILR